MTAQFISPLIDKAPLPKTRTTLRNQPTWIKEGILLGNAFHYCKKNAWIHNSINLSVLGLILLGAASLVPWMISLWWFFGVVSTYLLARAGLEALQLPKWCSKVGAIVLGAMLPTAWNLAFEPAQFRSAIRFWDFQQSGAYFGMPAFSFFSFFTVVVIVLSVATLLSKSASTGLQPDLPFVMYLSYFSLAIVLDLSTSMWIPLCIGLGFGLLPAIAL